MAKPIDKNYLIRTLKDFDEQILQNEYLKNEDYNHVDLENYYTKDEIDDELASKADLSSIPDVSNFATVEYVNTSIQNISMEFENEDIDFSTDY